MWKCENLKIWEFENGGETVAGLKKKMNINI